MAFDSRQKRMSLINWRTAGMRRLLPIPDGSLDTAQDRAMLLGMYTGIPFPAPSTEVIVSHIIDSLVVRATNEIDGLFVNATDEVTGIEIKLASEVDLNG
jgi:hypothetical protein